MVEALKRNFVDNVVQLNVEKSSYLKLVRKNGLLEALSEKTPTRFQYSFEENDDIFTMNLSKRSAMWALQVGSKLNDVLMPVEKQFLQELAIKLKDKLDFHSARDFDSI